MEKGKKRQEKWSTPKVEIISIKEQTLGAIGTNHDLQDETLS